MVVVAWQQRVLDDSDSGGCQTARVKDVEQWQQRRLLGCNCDIGSYFSAAMVKVADCHNNGGRDWLPQVEVVRKDNGAYQVWRVAVNSVRWRWRLPCGSEWQQTLKNEIEKKLTTLGWSYFLFKKIENNDKLSA